jgi:ABC-type multidrug transport system fused ATPase/permease subunit
MFSVRQRRAIRLASRFIAPYRWQALGALLALIVTAGITLSMGQGIRLLVDQGFMTQSPHLLNQSIGLFMLLVLGLAVGTFARFYLVSWIGERVVADIRRQVFNHLIYLHPGFYENNRSSEIQSRLTTDTTLLQSVIGSSLSLFLRNALMVLGGIVLLFVTNPKLTSIVVVALPLTARNAPANHVHAADPQHHAHGTQHQHDYQGNQPGALDDAFTRGGERVFHGPSNEIKAPADGTVQLPERVSGRMELQDVRFSYPSRPDSYAIDGLNLTINPGETLALVGPSGAGKSTIFDLLLRFYDPQQGRILLEGQPLTELDPMDLRRHFALVSQSPALFFGSVEENIRYGNPTATTEQVEAAARIAHAHDFILQMPNGYQTHLGDGGMGLSGGQRQRLAIARALLVDAPILLLDEATSALDAQSEHLIQQALPQLMQGRTTLVIAHRLATVKNADRIAVMDQGKLVAVGTHQQLIASNPLYARLAALQFSDGVEERVSH